MDILTARNTSRMHSKITRSIINEAIPLAAKALAGLVLAVLVLCVGCKKKPEPEGYRVVSYDAGTHQWVILRTGTFDGEFLRKRITVVCSLYKWGDHESISGPEACHLQVGRMIVPNLFPDKGKGQMFVDVYELPTRTLSIVEGDGPDRVMQMFSILNYEVLPDNATR